MEAALDSINAKSQRFDSLTSRSLSLRPSRRCRGTPAAPFSNMLRSAGNDTEGSGIQILVVVFALRGELHVFVSGFRVLEDFAFVIPDDDFLVIVIQNVTGIDRDLAAAARRIDDEL